MSGFQIIDDPWKQRSDAIYAWYLIYRSNSHIRRCVGPDIFRHVLKYLLVIDLTVPLYVDSATCMYLSDDGDGYYWVNAVDGTNSRTPCHVCLRPCVEFQDVLCHHHGHEVYNYGRESNERYLFFNTICHCKCSAAFIRMKNDCIYKIPHTILN